MERVAGSVSHKVKSFHAPFNRLKFKEVLSERGHKWHHICVQKHNDIKIQKSERHIYNILIVCGDPMFLMSFIDWTLLEQSGHLE